MNAASAALLACLCCSGLTWAHVLQFGSSSHLHGPNEQQFTISEFEGRITVGTKPLCHGPGNCFEVPAHQLESRGQSDVLIAKYNTANQIVWAVHVGGTKNDVAGGIVHDKWEREPAQLQQRGSHNKEASMHGSWSKNAYSRNSWHLGATTRKLEASEAVHAEAVNSTLYFAGVSEGVATFGEYSLGEELPTHARYVWAAALNASDGNIMWAREIAVCAPADQFAHNGTRMGKFTESLGQCTVHSLALDGNGDVIITGMFGGSFETPQTMYFEEVQIGGTLIGSTLGEGGLPLRVEDALGEKADTFVNTTQWGTVKYPKTWSTADGLEEEYQPMVVDGEWQATPSGGLCMHADNVDLSKLNDESWPQPVKDKCGWDWATPSGDTVRARLGESNHYHVFEFERGSLQVELESDDTGDVLHRKISDRVGANADTVTLEYADNWLEPRYDMSGKLVDQIQHNIAQQVQSHRTITELLSPIIGVNGTITPKSLNLTVCNSSDVTDTRLVNTDLCTGVKTDQFCFDTAGEPCKRAWTCPKVCASNADCMSSAFCDNRNIDPKLNTLGLCTARLRMCNVWRGTIKTNVLRSDAHSCYTRASQGHVCEQSTFVMKMDKWGSLHWSLPIEKMYVSAETLYWKYRADEFYSELFNGAVGGDERVPDNRKGANVVPESNEPNPHEQRPMYKVTQF